MTPEMTQEMALPSMRVDHIEPMVLHELVRVLMGPPILEPWQQPLTAAARSAIRATYFVLDRDDQGDDTESFIIYTLPRLLRRLNRQVEQQPTVYQGSVRGRIDWPATYKARYEQDYTPNRYVCRETRYDYDTPENQLLKYLIERIGECLRMIPLVLRTGIFYLADGRPPMTIAEQLESLESVLYNSRRHPAMPMVSLPIDIDTLHLLRAENASAMEYAQLARLYTRYQEIVVSPSWDAWFAVGRRVLLLPGQLENGGDLWVQLGAALLRAHQHEAGSRL